MKRSNKIITVLLIISVVFLIVSGSISLPILIRPFYYFQIDLLELSEFSGFTYDEIKEAFDQMMDFCLYGSEFGTGVLKWSEEGKSHFADCAFLFRLDLIVLVVSFLLTVILLLILRIRREKSHHFLGLSPLFYEGIIPLAFFSILGLLISMDFDRAFVIFHGIFFSGKTNWIFDPEKDEIIKILPEQFFMNCAILIIGALILTCIIMIIVSFVIKTRKKYK